jgi:uncharacterized protein with GYD domain
MASFIMAMSINPNAKKLHADLSKQINDSLEVFTRNHVKVAHLYATMGRYDIVAVFDTDDQKTAFKVASQMASMGILDTETWAVIPFEEFTELLH